MYFFIVWLCSLSIIIFRFIHTFYCMYQLFISFYFKSVSHCMEGEECIIPDMWGWKSRPPKGSSLILHRKVVLLPPSRDNVFDLRSWSGVVII